MDWADELAAIGQRARRSSTTRKTPVRHRPRRQPARAGHPRRHHPRAARAGHRDDAPLRRRRPRPDGRPGAPDARRRRARTWARPLAHVPDQAGDGHAVVRAPPRPDVHRHVRRPRHPPGPLLLDERHLPDRARWTRSSGRPSTAPHVVRDIYRRVAERPAPRRLAPGPRHLRDLRQGRHDDRHRRGTARRVVYECRPDLVTWARGCGYAGWVAPFGGPRQAALEPRVGGPVEPVRRDDRAAAARTSRPPAARATAPTRSPARSSSASRRSTSRTSSSTSAAARCRTSKGRGAAAHEIVEVVPPEQLRFLFLRPPPEPGDRVRPGGHGRHPAPVRRVRPARRRDRRPRGQGRAAARLRARSSATALRRPGRRRRGRGRGASGRRSATSRSSSRSRAWTSRRAMRRGEGESARPPRERGDPRRARRRRPRAGWRPTPRSAPGSRSARRAAGRGGRAWTPSSAPSSARSRVAADARRRRPAARRGRPRSSRRPPRPGCPPGRAFGALYLAFLGRPNGPRAGWLLASLDRGLRRSRRLREAAAGCDATPRR